MTLSHVEHWLNLSGAGVGCAPCPWRKVCCSQHFAKCSPYALELVSWRSIPLHNVGPWETLFLFFLSPNPPMIHSRPFSAPSHVPGQVAHISWAGSRGSWQDLSRSYSWEFRSIWWTGMIFRIVHLVCKEASTLYPYMIMMVYVFTYYVAYVAVP